MFILVEEREFGEKRGEVAKECSVLWQ